MKKKIILFGLLGTIAYGYEDLGFLSPELEKGVSGVSVSSNYRVINSDKSIADPIKDVYRIIKNNNEIMFDSLLTDTFDNNYLFNFDIGYVKSESLESPNISLAFATSLNEESRVGIGFNYNDFEGKYSSLKSKADGYQVDLFYQKQGFEQNITTILYVGSLDEKINKTNEKIDNTYWGVHARYEYLEESYNELFKGYRVDIEGKQLQKKSKGQKNTNDSIKASLKGIIKKEIEIVDNQKITFEIISGYEREFMEKRVYENIMNDDFRDSLALETKVSYKFEEIVTVYISVEGKKSLNTSNTETIANIGLKYNF